MSDLSRQRTLERRRQRYRDRRKAETSVEERSLQNEAEGVLPKFIHVPVNLFNKRAAAIGQSLLLLCTLLYFYLLTLAPSAHPASLVFA